MKKAKFLQVAKLFPSRFYRNPSDVMRDRRLTHEDRLQILAAWERDTRERHESENVPAGEPEQLLQLRRVREELERSHA